MQAISFAEWKARYLLPATRTFAAIFRRAITMPIASGDEHPESVFEFLAFNPYA
jgi:hypothetical protein